MTTPLAAIRASIRTYLRAPGRATALDAFQSRFLGPGELGFDVGAHVGDRAASFRRLGARAVAVEPQPRLARFLRLAFRGDLDGRVDGPSLGSDGVGGRLCKREVAELTDECDRTASSHSTS